MEKALTTLTALTSFTRFANHSTKGFTLIEVLICLGMMAAMSAIAAHLFSEQIALLQLDEVSQAFIQDAQLARQLSRQTNQTVTLKPLGNTEFRDWSDGWEITQNIFSSEEAFKTLKQYSLHGGHLKGRIQIAQDSLKDSQQFTDMSAPYKARHISFQSGNVALLRNGGFVANRIIWQHRQHPQLQMHVILGPGGRWRSCNPNRDNQKCL
jgi:type IV fimbrial biogenesis protein FimT